MATTGAVGVFIARVNREEGVRKFAYNDATGKQVTCKPDGNLTIGIGINLEVGLDSAEMNFLLLHRVELCDAQLQKFAWYGKGGAVRSSVFLDIAFNGGLHDLLGYPHMLAAADMEDWATAARNCTEKDPKLDASRYAPLRQLLLTGEVSNV